MPGFIDNELTALRDPVLNVTRVNARFSQLFLLIGPGRPVLYSVMLNGTRLNNDAVQEKLDSEVAQAMKILSMNTTIYLGTCLT